jgi:Mg2+-importing ATPase
VALGSLAAPLLPLPSPSALALQDEPRPPVPPWRECFRHGYLSNARDLSWPDAQLGRLRERLFGDLETAPWLGTDAKGRDLLARVVWGSRTSILTALAAALASLAIGVTFGAVAGFSGPRADNLMMRAVDALQSLPFIFLVIFLIGIVNEYRSELAVAALHANIRHETVVQRDGTPRRLDVRELVPGDVVSLSVGDLVPADVRLIEVSQLECDEGVLTGESMPAAKAVTPTSSDSAVDLPSCAFMGTVVHHGSAEAVVVATGPATAFGKIAVGLSERPAETAFQVGLRDFSGLLVRVAAVLTRK